MAEIGFVPMAAGGAVKCGFYTGDGQASRFISLGVTPKWVAVWNIKGQQFDYSYLDNNSDMYMCGGLALAGHPCGKGNKYSIEVVDGGFNVHFEAEKGGVATNCNDMEYYYLYGV